MLSVSRVLVALFHQGLHLVEVLGFAAGAISSENGSGMWRTTDSPLGEEISISEYWPPSVRSEVSMRLTAGVEANQPVFDQLVQVLGVLAQQDLPVGVVVGRARSIVLVGVLDAPVFPRRTCRCTSAHGGSLLQ